MKIHRTLKSLSIVFATFPLLGQNVSLTSPKNGEVLLTPRVKFGMNKNIAAVQKLKNHDSAVFCILIDLPSVMAGKPIDAKHANVFCAVDNDRNCPEAEICRSIDLEPGKHAAELQYSYMSGGRYYSYGKEYSAKIKIEIQKQKSTPPKAESYAHSGMSIDTYAAYRSTVNTLTVRARPDRSSKAVGSIGKDDMVHIKYIAPQLVTIDGKKAPWVLIETDQGLKGFVFYGYLEVIP